MKHFLILSTIFSYISAQTSPGLVTSSRRRVVLSADKSQSIELFLDSHICNNGVGQLYRLHSFTTPIFNSCANWCLRHSHCRAFDYESRRKNWFCWFYKSVNDCRPQPFIYAGVYVKRNLLSNYSVPTTEKTPAPDILFSGYVERDKILWTGSTTQLALSPTRLTSRTAELVTPLPVPERKPSEPITKSFIDNRPASSKELLVDEDSEVMVIPLIIENKNTPKKSKYSTKSTPKRKLVTSKRPLQKVSKNRSKNPNELSEMEIPKIYLQSDYFAQPLSPRKSPVQELPSVTGSYLINLENQQLEESVTQAYGHSAAKVPSAVTSKSTNINPVLILLSIIVCFDTFDALLALN